MEEQQKMHGAVVLAVQRELGKEVACNQLEGLVDPKH